MALPRAVARHLYLRLEDAAANRRYNTDGRRFLVLRDSTNRPRFYADFLAWLARDHPDVRALFELQLLPGRVRDWSRYLLVIPWLQDPVQDWSPRAYRRVQALADAGRAHGIAVINPVDRLANAVKSVALDRMRAVDVRTPRVVPIHDRASFRATLGGLEPPFIVREDRTHGGVCHLVERREDLQGAALERLQHPVAVEFVDVRSPRDGYCRKYRYLAAGARGVTRHLQLSESWLVRHHDVTSAAAVAEELAYLDAPDPNHEALQRARAALGLDVVAFDYAYDGDGRMIVWEPNPYPLLGYPKNPQRRYMDAFVERSFAALAALYLERAGLEVPPALAAALVMGAGSGTAGGPTPPVRWAG